MRHKRSISAGHLCRGYEVASAVASISYAPASIFRWNGSHEPAWRSNMSHRGLAALNRANGYLRSVIEAIAKAKIRRLQRELALRGVRYAFPEHGRIPRT